MNSDKAKIGPDGETVPTYTPPRPEGVVAYQFCWNIGTLSGLVIPEEGPSYRRWR